MKSVWGDEYRAEVMRTCKPYKRARRAVIVLLAAATALLATVTMAAIAMRDTIPEYHAFIFAAPVFCAANWILAIAFLRRLAATRDAALCEIDAAWRGEQNPHEAGKGGTDEI